MVASSDRVVIDDSTGTIEVAIEEDSMVPEQGIAKGMYVACLGEVHEGATSKESELGAGLRLKALKCIDISFDILRETMWNLEVTEVWKFIMDEVS